MKALRETEVFFMTCTANKAYGFFYFYYFTM